MRVNFQALQGEGIERDVTFNQPVQTEVLESKKGLVTCRVHFNASLHNETWRHTTTVGHMEDGILQLMQPSQEEWHDVGKSTPSSSFYCKSWRFQQFPGIFGWWALSLHRELSSYVDCFCTEWLVNGTWLDGLPFMTMISNKSD